MALNTVMTVGKSSSEFEAAAVLVARVLSSRVREVVERYFLESRVRFCVPDAELRQIATLRHCGSPLYGV